MRWKDAFIQKERNLVTGWMSFENAFTADLEFRMLIKT